MRIKIDVDDIKLAHFTTEAKHELFERSKEMTMLLIDEACRVEAARRESDAKQEITQADVIDATRSKRNRHRKQKWWQCVMQGICPVLAAVPGIVFDKEKIGTIIFTIIIAVVVTACTIYLIMEDNKNE